MSDLTDLERLKGHSRGRPRERRLVCPHCRGAIELRAGQYHCVKSEREGLPAPAFKTLAELAVEEG